MCVGMFMAILDIQIVASSLPESRPGSHIPLDRLSWIQTAYLIAEIVAIPLTGWLTRLLSLRGAVPHRGRRLHRGQRRLRASTRLLHADPGRIVQGFSGGMLIPPSSPPIFLLFPERLHVRAHGDRRRARDARADPGADHRRLHHRDLYWHWLFLINIGPGIVAARSRPASRCEPADRTAGPARYRQPRYCSAVSLATLELALKEAPERGWSEPVPVLLLALCAGRRRRRRPALPQRPRPLVELDLFRERCFAVGCSSASSSAAGSTAPSICCRSSSGYGAPPQRAARSAKIMIGDRRHAVVTAPVAAMLERRVDAGS